MPSLASLRSHLAHFLAVTEAAEVVLFERTTFLVISSVTAPTSSPSSSSTVVAMERRESQEIEREEVVSGEGEWDERRFERISTMVKAFKLGCSYVRLSLHAACLPALVFHPFSCSHCLPRLTRIVPRATSKEILMLFCLIVKSEHHSIR